MEDHYKQHCIEAAGSLTPELEGAPRSRVHPSRLPKKGREQPEAHQQEPQPIFLAETQTR